MSVRSTVKTLLTYLPTNLLTSKKIKAFQVSVILNLVQDLDETLKHRGQSDVQGDVRRKLGKMCAFTLAEVLITLGIIGIVAAITMSTLINKIQDKQFKSAYKKAFSAFSQAVERAKQEDELLSLDGGQYDDAGTQINTNFGENFKIVSKYFNNVKTCFEQNADICWVCEEGEAGYIYNGGAPNWLGCNKKSYAFVDASGTSWYMYSNQEAAILLDVNGSKKPNKLGKDRFVFYFATALSSALFFDRVDKIVPNSDITKKGRWCPSGNCLYKTWLLD